MEERKLMEKNLETKKILEVSREMTKMSNLHAAYAKGQIVPRKIIDIVESPSVDIARNLDIRRMIVIAKISITQILLKSMLVCNMNTTMSNIFSTLPKILVMN